MKQNRLERVIRGMEAMGLEQIIVSAPASVFYLTGTWVRPGERMLALYVHKSGEARLFLQFRNGRLSGWKGDWGRNWMWQ